MALDTRGLASGFAQGFGMMNNYYNQKAQNERAERGLQMREESFEMQKEQYQKAQEKETAAFVYGKIMNDLPLAEEEQAFLKNNPTYLAALNPAMDQTIEVAERVVDPEDPLDFNSDEALYAMNTGFEAVINRGNGGNKRIAAGLPGAKPGTMSFDLDVEREDGTRERQPLTANRGTADDGDDEVKQVPVENMVNTVQGMRMIRNGFAGVPGGKERAAKMYALLTGKTPERTKGIEINDRLVNPETGQVLADLSDGPDADSEWRRLNDGRLYNQRTGEVKDVGEGEFGGSGRAPADVQTAEWMMSVGLAENYDQAWSLLNESRTDPTRFVANYVDQEMKAQEQAGIYPDMEGYKTTAQMRDDALKALQTIRQSTRGTGSGDQQPGLQLPGQSGGGQPVRNDDGSYSGPVNREPVVRSDADYERLPVGAIFVDEDGKKYRKQAE